MMDGAHRTLTVISPPARRERRQVLVPKVLPGVLGRGCSELVLEPELAPLFVDCCVDRYRQRGADALGQLVDVYS